MKTGNASVQHRMSLHSAVVEQIGSLIAQGILPTGSVLPNEATLGDEFGVSRTALREAIKVLASKGLVEVRRKTGTRVKEQADWNMLDPEVLEWMFSGKGIPSGLGDLMEVRMLVEPAAARMAAERSSTADMKEIREAYEEMANTTENLPSSVESDLRFHMAVLEATHNAFMRPFGALIQAALRGSFRLTSINTTLYRAILPLHKTVLDCIALREANKAEMAMKSLLKRTMHDIENQARVMRDKNKNQTTVKRKLRVTH